LNLFFLSFELKYKLPTLISDLSWNYIGETGAALLLESLKNNEILIELSIQGNSVSVKMSAMIGMPKIKVLTLICQIYIQIIEI